MSKYVLVTYFVIGMTIIGCVPTNAVPVETVATPGQIIPTLTATSVSTVIPAPTSAPEIGTLSNTICPVSPSENSYDLDIDGEFILLSLNLDEDPYLLNFATRVKTYLPHTEGHYLEEFRVSPNNQFTAYFARPKGTPTTVSRLIVSDSKGQILFERAIDRINEWYLIDTWINNQTLMLERYQTLPGSNTLDSPLPTTLFNPFTDESRDMDGDFPNMLFFFEPLAHWDVFGKSGTAYDPTINLVAYASESRDDLRESVVLWDIKMNQDIARIQAAIGFGSGPVWSPDGSQFIVDSLARIPPDPRNWTEAERLSEEIFSVSRAGEITRLTYLTNQFQEVSIEGYIWSPDRKYIAFQVVTRPDIKSSNGLPGPRLAILNTVTKEINIYCLQSYPGAGRMFWAPDGNSILMGIKNIEKSMPSNNTSIYDTVLIDLTRNAIFKIEEETLPLGWMIQKP